MIQIGQWYGKHEVRVFVQHLCDNEADCGQNKDLMKKPTYWPAVRLWNIEERVLHDVQLRDRDGIDNINSDSDNDSNNSDNDNQLGPDDNATPASAHPEAGSFVVDPDIDIEAQALRDMVSTDPIKRKPVPVQCGSETISEAITKEPDWEW